MNVSACDFEDVSHLLVVTGHPTYNFIINEYGGQAPIGPKTETKHLTTMNCRISAVMYFESRCLTSCPHLRKVSRVNPTHGIK